MTESDGSAASPAIGVDSLAPTAGAMLRAAREQRGVHIAALAAAIKVPQRKLEALEGDRYDELPDLTFTRALAQSVCRTLKIDMQPVLDRLPHSTPSPKLDQVGAGLNAPFRERPGREEPTDWSWLRKPVVWGTLLVLAAAVAMALMPDNWFKSALRARMPAVTPAAQAPAPTEPASAVVILPVTPTVSVEPAAVASSAVTAPLPATAAAPPPMPAPVAFGAAIMGLKASAESWVEVQDARGQTLLSRHLAAGEALGLDGALPLRVTIGNALATQVTFRGAPVDLSPNTIGNVARMQLN